MYLIYKLDRIISMIRLGTKILIKPKCRLVDKKKMSNCERASEQDIRDTQKIIGTFANTRALDKSYYPYPICVLLFTCLPRRPDIRWFLVNLPEDTYDVGTLSP